MLDRAGREGWEVVRTFEAPGESASTRDLNKRPVLRELVEAARRREFDLVLFHESSRLARDEELSQWLINELEAYGVRLVESAIAVRRTRTILAWLTHMARDVDVIRAGDGTLVITVATPTGMITISIASQSGRLTMSHIAE